MNEAGDIEVLDTPVRNYSQLQVSPDGSRVVMTIGSGLNNHIYVYDLDGNSEMRRLTFQGSNTSPSWSPDSQWIAYRVLDPETGNMQLMRTRPDGRGVPEELTPPFPGQGELRVIWHPGSDGIFYNRVAGASRTFEFRVIPQPGEASEIYQGMPALDGFQFSPDGSAVLYEATGSNLFRAVFLEPFPPDGSRLLVAEGSVGGEDVITDFFWSHDGSRINYVTIDSNILYSVDVDLQDFTLSNRTSRELPASLQGASFSAIPGTGNLLVSLATEFGGGPADSATLNVIVVQNWIEEIMERIPLE